MPSSSSHLSLFVSPCPALLLPLYSSIFIFSFSSSGHHRDLHSFPTRRSSDLVRNCSIRNRQGHSVRRYSVGLERLQFVRSEEHTSELQSLTNLVCRLLLEKKKKKHKKYTYIN